MLGHADIARTLLHPVCMKALSKDTDCLKQSFPCALQGSVSSFEVSLPLLICAYTPMLYMTRIAHMFTINDIQIGIFSKARVRVEDPACAEGQAVLCRDFEQMVGVWTDADRNSLCVFDWRSNCVEGTRLMFDSMRGAPSRTPFCRLSSEGQVSMDLQPGSKNCWLREYHVQDGRLIKSSCEKAEAATSVAIGRNNV